MEPDGVFKEDDWNIGVGYCKGKKPEENCAEWSQKLKTAVDPDLRCEWTRYPKQIQSGRILPARPRFRKGCFVINEKDTKLSKWKS